MKLKHIGNGVVVYPPSGIAYEAQPGQVIDLLPVDYEALLDHPEWERLDDDHDEDNNSSPDHSGEEE